MSFLELGGYERFTGENKTVLRGDELVYTVNPDDMMGVMMDTDWYEDATLQLEVWDHNLQRLQEAGIPLTFDDYRQDATFCEITTDRIDGHLVSPSLVADEYTHVEPYDSMTQFSDIPEDEAEQVRKMQDELETLIYDGEIAVKERELAKTDYHGNNCLRQWGRDRDGTVYLLEFGEYHHQLEGPYTGPEFLEEHDITPHEDTVDSPVTLRGQEFPSA